MPCLSQSVLTQQEARFNSTDLNIAYRMPVSEYTQLCEYSEALEENWGKPPGNLNSNGQELLIYGQTYGNVFIGVQPTFGYEGDPMRLLFSRSASPHHGFAAYYTFLEKIFKADAVLHFGTHGSLEFMPGKQVREPPAPRGQRLHGAACLAACMPACLAACACAPATPARAPRADTHMLPAAPCRCRRARPGWHERRVLPGQPDRHHPQPLLLRCQQPERGDHRQTPQLRQHHQLPDAAR